jgi:hypothetical protein
MYSMIGMLATADHAAYGHALRPKGIGPNGPTSSSASRLPVWKPDRPTARDAAMRK